jgi:hypothetical protein
MAAGVVCHFSAGKSARSNLARSLGAIPEILVACGPATNLQNEVGGRDFQQKLTKPGREARMEVEHKLCTACDASTSIRSASADRRVPTQPSKFVPVGLMA